MTRRQEKINSLLERLISQFLSYHVRSDIMITVLKAEITGDLRQAKIFIDVFPETKEKEALDWLQKKKKEIKKRLSENLKIRLLPEINFEIDRAEKARQRVEEILKKEL